MDAAEQMTRRQLLYLGVGAAFSGALYGCRCATGFPPNLTMPVLSGYKDYVITDVANEIPCSNRSIKEVGTSAPVARVFYPTIDGTQPCASMLTGCEQFPLVLLIHGSCPGVDPYIQWSYFAGQLARAGYVVAITSAGGMLATGNPSDVAPFQQVYNYMRNTWEYRATLMPSPNTAIAGHSYGGTRAAELAGVLPLKAFVSLSGTFGQVVAPLTVQALLSNIRVPSLFFWNQNDDIYLNATMYVPSEPVNGQMWSFIGAPKHGVLFAGPARHGDYLVAGTAGGCAQGDCSLIRPLAADLATTFLTKYLPPQSTGAIRVTVPDTLFVRPQDLPPPPTKVSYAANYLTGLASSKLASGVPNSEKVPCYEQLFWETKSQGTTYLVPA
jgi:hypothetical protein